MRKFLRFFLLFGAAALFFLFVIVVTSFGATNPGQAAYNQYCSGCHGLDGNGGPYSIAGWTVSDVTNMARTGGGGMPAFSTSVISDSQLNKLARYVSYSLGPGGDTTPPTVSNVQPVGAINSSSATLRGTLSDTGGSGINSASEVVYLDGNTVSGCNKSSSSVSCNVSGIANGNHSVLVYVEDNAAWAAYGTSTFTSDTIAPTISNIQPSGTIYSASATISAYYSDAGSGINSASAQVYLDGSTVSGCTATATQVSCPVSGLSLGSHGIQVKVKDMAGNSSSGSGNFNVNAAPADTTPPVVSNIAPAGTISTASATISAYYSDAGSGINSASAQVYLDGSTVSGCTATASQVSCPVSGLSLGSHSIQVKVKDLAGNQGSGSGSFTVSDNAAPVIGGITPAGGSWINTSSASIVVYYSDDLSGINTGSNTWIQLDGSTLSGCAKTQTSMSCPAAGLSDGSHTLSIRVTDNAGNQANATSAFSVDTVKPTISGLEPSGTITTASTTVYANYSDAGSGINSASAQVYLDGSTVSGCTATATQVSCPVSGLSLGSHSIQVKVKDLAGNQGSASGGFTVDTSPGADTTPPDITNVSPTGSMRSHSASIVVYYNDGTGSGVDTGSVSVTLDGNPVNGCTVTATQVSCPIQGVIRGRHEIHVSVSDNSGNTSSTTTSFTTSSNYYWTWYDGQNAANWILMGNPLSGPNLMDFKLSIENEDMDLAASAVYGHAPGEVPRGKSITPSYPGVMNGPVMASSMTGDSAIVSQRSIWRGNSGGKSIEEVPGIDENRLSSHYYWTWYDMLTGDYKNWVLVANPNSSEIWYRIKIAGREVRRGTLQAAGQPGDRVTPTFPGVIGGPVEVEAAADQYFNTPAKAIASQRVLMHGDNAFNEVPGIPAEELSDQYLWTWYDMRTPGAVDWLLVANPSGTDQVDYQIEIGSKGCDPNPANRPAGSACKTGTLDPGEMVTPTFPGIITGPVSVKAVLHGTSTPAKVIASQRTLWGPSFEETPGLPAGALYNGMSSGYYWTWYDQASAGAVNWVLVANPGGAPVNYSIKIAGQEVRRGTLEASGQPGDRVTPTFSGIMNGPVEVTAWSGDVNNEAGGTPTDVVASQRYLWSGYFNEVLGTTLN